MSILVLIDWQNLFKTCENLKISPDETLEEILRRAQERGQIEEIRLFVPNYQFITSPWRLINSLQLKYGLKVEVCPVLREGAEMDEESFKDLVDLSVFAWVTQYVRRFGPELVVFVSGDGHFLLAANEVKRKGKEVEFWIIDPEATSGAILKNATVRKIEISDRAVLIATKENSFLLTLNRATTGKELSAEERQRLDTLNKAAEILPRLEKPLTLEMKAKEISRTLQEQLNIPEQDAQQIVEVFLATEMIRIYTTASAGFSLDSSSWLFQWLTFFGKA